LAVRATVERWLADACNADAEVELLIYLHEPGEVFAEGRAAALTCAASLQLDDDGAPARTLGLSCPLVTAPPAWEPAVRPDIGPRVERYFEALNDGDFAAAASCFTEDCLYVHPPYRPGEPPAEFHGRAELAEQWPRRRGTRRVETRIERCMQSGNHAFVEGVAGGGSFLSSIVLDADGLISRYVAFYTPRLVPRLAPIPDQPTAANLNSD
jgi:hypothetical protein